MGDMQEAGVLLRVTVDAVLPDGLHMAESPVCIYIGQNSTDDFHYRVKTTRIVPFLRQQTLLQCHSSLSVSC